jgi:hypothetical protein
MQLKRLTRIEKMIKKIMILIMSALMILSCAASNLIVENSNSQNINVNRFVSTCGIPEESYFIEQIRVIVHRHKDCMGITDMLTVVWSGTVSEKDIQGVSLLAIAYATKLTKEDPTHAFLARFLKVDSFVRDNRKTHAAFFEIKKRIKK